MACGVAALADGGFVVTGFTYSNDGDPGVTDDNNNGFSDAWVIRLDAEGNKRWGRVLGGTRQDKLQRAIELPDGNILLAGVSQSSDFDLPKNEDGFELWLLKLSADGTTVRWSNSFGGNSDELEIGGIVAASDGYIVSTSTASNNGADVSTTMAGVDLWLVKTDADGHKIWDKSFGGTGVDWANSMIAGADGCIIVCGFTSSQLGNDISTNHGGTDGWVIKLDAGGNKLWSKTYGGVGADYANSITALPDGGFVFAGTTYSRNSGDVGDGYSAGRDIWLMKLDASGNRLWSRNFGGDDKDQPAGIIASPDGSFVIGCNTYSSNTGDIGTNKGSGDIVFAKFK